MDQVNCSNEIALHRGTWVKLICGASNEDLPSITDLCAIYAAAGVHCVDVSADIAVATAAREGLQWAASNLGKNPWLMISVSDGKDIHFRKAYFDPKKCPEKCSKPCLKVCPADAISENMGVLKNRCYGCGRCLPVCPLEIIKEENNFLKIEDFGIVIQQIKPDAIEIHTAPGRIQEFTNSVREIVDSKVELKRIAISCGLEGHGITKDELSKELWSRYQCLRHYKQKLIWQLDGRPMSGDLGLGTAKAAVLLLEKMQSIVPPGPLQLAGGTNEKTIHYLTKNHCVAGVAFGGMARKLIQPFLIEAKKQNKKLIDNPKEFHRALKLARFLIQPWLDKESQVSD
ncbi:Light dependent period modulator LdpA [Prochlorococcus sp. MIT 0602]|nr:Light dependent period modulator LdpA [Prochlorococcus sp. MIT 0602]KGG15896.1 Light dependent period modulator LdpA [Prochlorococcus sp. MIT 0603]